jgi:hypothetical protein
MAVSGLVSARDGPFPEVANPQTNYITKKEDKEASVSAATQTKKRPYQLQHRQRSVRISCNTDKEASVSAPTQTKRALSIVHVCLNIQNHDLSLMNAFK